jgi:hypothetical protein
LLLLWGVRGYGWRRGRCLLKVLVTFVIERGPHPYIDRKPLTGVPVVDPPDRRDIAVIAAVCDSHVLKTYVISECGI